MSDKKGFMGLAALAAAGAGAAMLMKKTKEINEEENFHVKETTANYRNTERGKHDKNSKGIYYSNGNYEAFARPEKPEGVDDKHAYIVGSGLASLAAACFLVRDAQMPGDHIHILEAMDIAGGACDGIFDPSRGYIMRGGREMENHFECLWDLFRSIPSLEKPGASAFLISLGQAAPFLQTIREEDTPFPREKQEPGRLFTDHDLQDQPVRLVHPLGGDGSDVPDRLFQIVFDDPVPLGDLDVPQGEQ